MVLSPGTPSLLPHKIQTPNVTLERKFVTGVRSETHIKPHKFLGEFFDRIPVSECLVFTTPLA